MSNFIAPCKFSGEDCSEDEDGCEGNPCGEGMECVDTPASDMVAGGPAYMCTGTCPEGSEAREDTGECQGLQHFYIKLCNLTAMFIDYCIFTEIVHRLFTNFNNVYCAFDIFFKDGI